VNQDKSGKDGQDFKCPMQPEKRKDAPNSNGRQNVQKEFQHGAFFQLWLAKNGSSFGSSKVPPGRRDLLGLLPVFHDLRFVDAGGRLFVGELVVVFDFLFQPIEFLLQILNRLAIRGIGIDVV
jgi:hypothetical protein